MMWPPPHPPNRPSPCTTGATAPYTHFIQGLACGRRLAHRMTSVLASPNYSNDARALLGAAMWPPGKAPQESCQIGQWELVCGHNSTKQPTSNRYPGDLSQRQREVCWLLPSGPGAGQGWPQSCPREQPREKGCQPEPCRLPLFLLLL